MEHLSRVIYVALGAQPPFGDELVGIAKVGRRVVGGVLHEHDAGLGHVRQSDTLTGLSPVKRMG